MTRSNLIFTHGAVFSVGIAAAMIVNGFRAPQPMAAEESQQRGARNLSAARLERDEGSAATKTARSQQRAGAKRETGPPAERLADLVRIPDSFERQRALMNLIDTLGPAEFAGIADQFRQLDHLGDTGDEYELILRGWAKVDPLTALEYVNQHPNSGRARTTILATWAGTDGAAATRWALDHHEGEGANPHMAAVIRGIAGVDLAEASRLAQEMPLSRERRDAVESITRALFLQSPEAAMAYPASIQDEALRGGFVAAIASRMIEKDVSKAAAWVASLDQGEVQNRAARNVADALARMDPKAAAAWVRTLKPEAQAEAARGVIPIMSSGDITGTAQWVSGLAGTPNYDRVVEEFVWSCNTRAPEQSAAWIQGVSNPEQQNRLYHRMLGEWAQKDAAAVKNWVQANNVPDGVRRRFNR